MLTIEEMSDRLEIMDLLASYSHAIDQRQSDALDDVFAEDALIVLPEVGQQLGVAVEPTTAPRSGSYH